jgi:cytoskeletal protein CcmA (bactofilin family)
MRKVIKNTLNKLWRDEKGQALPIALAMLAIGSLVITPLLNLTMTSIRAGVSDESRMYEHYAANAGIGDGILNIITGDPQLPAVGENWTYSIPDTNDRGVDVIITRIDSKSWKITSTAISGNGTGTKLDCYAESASIPSNAISGGQVTIESGSVINGNVQWETKPFKNNGTINGEIINAALTWPDVEYISAYYLERVEGAPAHEGELNLNLGPETVADPYSLGPIYINGNLVINSVSEGAVRLDGDVYVNGAVIISGNTHVYANYFTIFANSSFAINSTSVSVGEYGCFVAKHTIAFYSSFEPGSYIVAWSIQNLVNFYSTAVEFNGSVLGYDSVFIGSDNTINWSVPPPGLSVPPFGSFGLKIVGWESTLQ